MDDNCQPVTQLTGDESNDHYEDNTRHNFRALTAALNVSPLDVSVRIPNSKQLDKKIQLKFLLTEQTCLSILCSIVVVKM